MPFVRRQAYAGNGQYRHLRKSESSQVTPDPIDVDRERQLADTFLRAVQLILASPLLQFTRLVKLLEHPVGYLTIADTMPWDVFEIELRRAERILVEQLADSGRREVSSLPTGRLSPFDYRDPNVLIYGARHAADLVTEVVEEQRRLLRNLVVGSHLAGQPPMTLAHDIRNAVGLTARYEGAVSKFHRGMIDKGVHPAFAAKQAKNYRDRLLTSRAKMIARTEIMKAENEGKVLGWKHSIANGLMTGGGVKRWVTAPTNVCPVCVPMDGKEVGLDDTFLCQTPQKRMYDVRVPPAHPHCRCTVTYLPPKTEDLFAQYGLSMEDVIAEITGDPRSD